MRLVLAVVGRPRDPALAGLIREYETRARRYWPLEVVEVKEESARATPSAQVRAREAERLRASAPGARLVVCDERGKSLTSAEFAAWLQRIREDARDTALVIGGAFGLADDLRRDAELSLSLAPWTLPHEMARLVLAEQLYRAGTIVRGEPYHK